jgi:filamentous hemagglutinin
LTLFYSQIRSEGGGDIELLVPGGYINSGLAVAGTLNKPATDLGIVSIRGGVIDSFVRNNFQVNQSRVFTLGGSDLMLYSALTNIDAGRGAKTSAATPPPVLRTRNGQITYDYSAAVSGSGIAALTATGGEAGTVDLFAPYGEINAGEAGIRSAGNINLGARVIIGSENISAGGVTAGGPVASVAGLSVSAPASTNSSSQGKQGDQVGDAAKQASSNKLATLPSLISVEVLSVGDDSSASNKPCGNKKDCQI